MRKWIKYAVPAIILSSAIVDAYAVAPGFYMGFMAGPATNGANTENVQVLPLPTASSPIATSVPANARSSQFGSRVYLGYKFNVYAAFEGGFTYFSGINFNPTTSAQPAGGTTARIRGIDIMGKVDYSLPDSFGVFGKAGVALMYLTTPGGLTPTNYKTLPAPTPTNPSGVKIINSGSNQYTTKASPVLAAGVSYDFNQNWVMDLSWTRYFAGSPVNNMDLYALGLSYHFTDKYCGQFLCD